MDLSYIEANRTKQDGVSGSHTFAQINIIMYYF